MMLSCGAVMCLAGGIWFGTRTPSPPRELSSRPLTQEAYVWQMNWTREVADAARDGGALFSSLAIHSADITAGQERIKISTANVNWKSMAESRRPVSLVWRITEDVIAKGWTDTVRTELANDVTRLLETARKQGVDCAEAQIDCDCPTRLLSGYAKFMNEIRARDSRVRWTFTALPSWLHHADFKTLAKSADGFVIQVHWLQADAKGNPVLMVAATARRAVLEASRAGVPFRVALPTYGSVVAVDGSGAWLDVASEERIVSPPPGVTLREASADPVLCLELLQEWKQTRPAWMTGIVWYRLPVPADERNWSLAQLRSVMEGRVPTARWEVASRAAADGHEDLTLTNAGDGDASPPRRVTFRTQEMIGADGSSFYTAETTPEGVIFHSSHARPIKAGTSITLGWIRKKSIESAGKFEIEP